MVDFQAWHYLVIPCLILLHLAISPYTKVEESFNIQAIHDILKYGIPTSNVYYKFKALYDHMTFSGSVPRTFIGALVTSTLAHPLIWLSGVEGLNKQITTRSAIGLLNGLAFTVYIRSVSRAYGSRTALWYIALQATQFHVIYYASRTLPNTFAFCLSTFALAATLPDPRSNLSGVKRARLCFYLLTLATVIFRSELALLLGSQALYTLVKARSFDAQVSIFRNTILPAVLSAFIVGVALTVFIDTYFWQSPNWVWPEAAAFLFNVLPSKDHLGASAWGTSPWHWYFTSAIPKLMLSPGLFLIPWGIVFTTQRQAILDQIVPAFSYTALYSILPHKETRFLFPIVPPITLAIALGASYISNRRNDAARLITILLIMTTTLTGLISHTLILPLSAQSYPGGQALQMLHKYHNNLTLSTRDDFAMQPQINVHLTNLALQTGITRFLEQPPTPAIFLSSLSNANNPIPPPSPIILPGSPDGSIPALTHIPKPSDPITKRKLTTDQYPLWLYDKSSSEPAFLTPAFWSQFDYVIVEDPARVIGAWEIIAETKALRRGRPKILTPGEKRGRIALKREEQEDGSEDALFELISEMYGGALAWCYGVLHDVLREGAFVGKSPTGGYWIDWGLETRLYVLRRSESGVST